MLQTCQHNVVSKLHTFRLDYPVKKKVFIIIAVLIFSNLLVAEVYSDV